MRLLLTSEAELCYLRGLQLVYVKRDCPSLEGLHCVDVIFCSRSAVNLAVFVDRHDIDKGFTRCLYIAIFNHKLQPIIRKLELMVMCRLERNQICIVDSTKLVLVEHRMNKNDKTRIFYISLLNYKPEKQCAEFIGVPKEKIVTGVYKNLHNSPIFIQLFDETNSEYEWIMCCDINKNRLDHEVKSSNDDHIFKKNHAYAITRSNDSDGNFTEVYRVTALSDISGIHNIELQDKLITIITSLSGGLFVYCNETILAHLDNIKHLMSANVTISTTCCGASGIYAFIYCSESDVLLVASVSLQSSTAKLLLQCANIKAYQYSSLLTPMYNHLLLLPSSKSSSTNLIIIDVSKYGSKYCILGSKVRVWQVAPAAFDALAILSDDTASKRHKKTKSRDVPGRNYDPSVNDTANKLEIHNIDTNAQQMVIVAVQSRLQQIKKKIFILENLLDGKYLALISVRNMIRQMLCVALANRPVAINCTKRMQSITCNHIVENVLIPFHLDSISDPKPKSTYPYPAKAVENDAVINDIVIKDITYQPIPNSWSILVVIRVSNASLLPVFNLHAHLHAIEPNIHAGSGVNCNIRVNSRISTLSGCTSMVSPNGEAWLFAKAELPSTLFTSTSTYCTLSVSLSWTEIHSTNSKLSTYTSTNSGEAGDVAELLEILSKDKYRSSLELSLGWLPRIKQSKSMGLILLSSKEFIWNVNMQRKYEINRCKMAPYFLGRKLCGENSQYVSDMLHCLLLEWLKDAESREVGAVSINSYIKSVNLVIEGNGEELGAVDINQLNSIGPNFQIPMTHTTTASQRIESVLRCISTIQVPFNHCISSHIIVYDDWNSADSCEAIHMRLAVNSALYSERLISTVNVLQSLRSDVLNVLSINSASNLQLVSSNEHRFHLVRLASLYMLEEMKVLALAYREQKINSNSLPQDGDIVFTVGNKLKIKNNLVLGKLLLSRQLQTDVVISLLL